MAEIKDKVVTVDSLSALHNYNQKMYLPVTNPEIMGSLTLGNIKLVPTEDSLDIVFIDEATQEIVEEAEESLGDN